MRLIDAREVEAATPYPALIEAIAKGLATPVVSPLRGSYDFTGAGDVLLTMPAWREGGTVAGIKLVTVYPSNGARGLPAIDGLYVAFDQEIGKPIAVIDGATLTARRTAAASALAARHLARPDARRMLVVGTGAVSSQLPEAHAAVHALERIAVWARDAAKAEALAAALEAKGLPATAVRDLEAAAGEADIIAGATTATTPFLKGAWLRPGTHLSLMGAFTKTMAELDEEGVRRARIFADTRAGVLEKGGEVYQAIASGVIAAEAIEAELAELIARPIARAADDITFFKSVGFASLDLAAAEAILAGGP